jgi:5'-nucleotidase
MPHRMRARSTAMVAVGASALALAIAPLTTTAASAAIVPEPVTYSAPDAGLSLSPVGSFETGVFDASASEIVQAHGDRLFVVSAAAGSVIVLDYADPTNMRELFRISSTGTANSVAIRPDGLGVIAFEAPDKVGDGHLLFFDADAADAASATLGTVPTGALPDMVTFSPDGAYALVANEGEPSDDFTVDPEGSISVVSVPDTVAAPAPGDVRTADFHAFEADGATPLPDGVRVYGPTPHGADHPVSRNLEPEYITVADGVAYATLQEANAIATIDLATATVSGILPLGFKDHGLAANALDPSDRDGRYELRTYEGLYGMYEPDSISSYSAGGTTYLVTANEGDAREWGDYAEPVRVKNLASDGYGPVCADSPLAGYTSDADLGRLNVSREMGFDATNGCYSELYAMGGRSFSIWTTSGELVYDSGSSFEEITYAAAPDNVNSNHSESNFDGRSDDKGPEPEGVTIGVVGGRTYAFVGFERVGGIAAYDVSDPAAASFVTYVNNRDFGVSAEDDLDGAADPAAVLSSAGDLGPEGVAFIPAESSPTGAPLLAVGNEVSGTTTVFAVDDLLSKDVRILTINDFHGRLAANGAEVGAAVLAGAVGQLRAENPNTLFVSAGDNIGASTFTSFIQRDEPTIDALLAAGLDVSAVGNHEFDRGMSDLTGRVLPRYGDPRYGLGANVYDATTGEPLLDEYAIQVVDGVRVGFIGVVTPATATLVSPQGIEGVRFGDMLEAADRVAAELTAGDLADVIVLLAHDGMETGDCAALATADTDYAQLVRGADPAIDAIVSGHTHQTYACDIPVDGVAGTERPVIQAHQYGTTLGTLDLTIDANGGLAAITGGTLPLADGTGAPLYPADPTVATIVADAQAVADEQGSVEVGAISGDILRGKTSTGADDRGVESSLGNLVADVYLWATSDNPAYGGEPAQIGLMNPGGLRDDLRYGVDGTMTYQDVAAVQPFANTLVTMTLTGAQLKQVLEEQWQPDGASRPKLHLGVSDGFSYTFDAAAARGAHITSMTYRGSAIAAGDTVRVVTNSFLAAGGDAFATFTSGTARADSGQVDLQATVDFFLAHPLVDPAPLGRAMPASTPGGGDGGGDGTVADWATIDVGSGKVPQGGVLTVSASGLTPGLQLGAVLHSDPIVVRGIAPADASGRTVFTVAIPADFDTGLHTLVITAPGFDPITVQIEVVRAGALAVTGAEPPYGFAAVAGGLVLAGAAVLLLRRRTRTAR